MRPRLTLPPGRVADGVMGAGGRPDDRERKRYPIAVSRTETACYVMYAR